MNDKLTFKESLLVVAFLGSYIALMFFLCEYMTLMAAALLVGAITYAISWIVGWLEENKGIKKLSWIHVITLPFFTGSFVLVFYGLVGILFDGVSNLFK